MVPLRAEKTRLPLLHVASSTDPVYTRHVWYVKSTWPAMLAMLALFLTKTMVSSTKTETEN